MSEHDPEALDELLAAWLAGDVSSTDPRLSAARASSEEFDDRFRALADSRRELAELGRQERELLREARGLDSPDLEELVRAVVEGASAPSPPEPNLRALGVAAAIIALILGTTWLRPRQQESDWRFLGSASEDVSPRGPVERLDRFRWSLPLPPGGSYRLRIWRDRDGARGERLLSAEPVEPWFEVPDDVWAEWRAIVWEVESVGPMGTVLGTGGARAERLD